MKNLKFVKILVILIIVCISMISFVGIYGNVKGVNKNKVQDYKLGMNLSDYRTIILNINEGSEDIIYDKDGKETEDGLDEEGNLLEGYIKVNKKINPDEILTEENFKMSKDIVEARLKKLGIEEYIIKQNNENGSIIVQIPENDNTDKIVSYLSYPGKFEIKDTQTNEILMNNNDVKESKVLYSSATTGTAVYFSVEFNKEGKEKFKNITNTYKEDTNATEETTETEKTITIYVDGEKLIETGFDKVIDTGLLQLSIGTPTTDSETLTNYVEQASSIASLVTSKNMPIEYEISQNMNMESEIKAYILPIIYIMIGLLVIAFIYLIVRYKLSGMLSVISHIGFIALLLLTLRYTNVIISLEAIVAFIAINIVNLYLLNCILNKYKTLNIKEAIKEAYVTTINLVIPLLIIGVTFTFANWTAISSIGNVMFWGLLLIVIYNYVITQLLIKKDEE